MENTLGTLQLSYSVTKVITEGGRHQPFVIYQICMEEVVGEDYLSLYINHQRRNVRKVNNIVEFLPPAYVVRRESNVLTRVCPSICLSTWGGGGQSADSARGGVSRGGVSQPGGSASQGGSVSWGVGVSQLGGGGWSAKIGQQNEYSLHGGRYASCVHAGELSCS